MLLLYVAAACMMPRMYTEDFLLSVLMIVCDVLVQTTGMFELLSGK